MYEMISCQPFHKMVLSIDNSLGRVEFLVSFLKEILLIIIIGSLELDIQQTSTPNIYK